MPKRAVRIFLTTQGTQLNFEGDLEIDVVDGVLIVRDYDKRPEGVDNALIFSAAKGFWASVGIVEVTVPDGA